MSDKRGQISRKDFLKLLGAGGAGLLIGGFGGFGNLFSHTNNTKNSGINSNNPAIAYVLVKHNPAASQASSISNGKWYFDQQPITMI